MRCLALDVGSTSIKGAVLDLARGAVESTVSRPFPAPIGGLASGWFEVSLSAVEREVEHALDALLAFAPDANRLYCSGQMGGIVVIDASGRPASHYISWRDQRTLESRGSGGTYLDAVRRCWGDDVLASLGNELQPGSTTGLLFWLARHGRLPAGATFATIADFLLARRCGVKPTMHVTHAVGMLDHRTGDWHRAAFDRLHLGEIRFPESTDRIAPIGQFSLRGQTLEVFGSFGDQQCALRGAGLRPEELSLNISTGSQVSRRTQTFSPGRYQTRRYFDGEFLDTITHLPAGRSLNVLVDLLTELAVAEGLAVSNAWDTIVRKAAEVDATNLEVDLAFFAGPLGSTGGIRSVTTENLTVGQLFFAAFRSMAENYAKCAEWLDHHRAWKSVVLSGGLAQSIPQLRRMIQGRFHMPLRETNGDETLLGLLDIARATN